VVLANCRTQELGRRAALLELENKIAIRRFVERDITYGAGMEGSGTADSSDAPI